MIEYCKRHKEFVGICIVLLIYNIWCLFFRTFIYDEYWTFNQFISNGFGYVYTHYNPSNHMFYSELATLIYAITGNVLFSMRIIPCVCSLVNIFLLYYLCYKFFGKWESVGAVLIYLGNWMVNSKLVMGRGYTLSMTFFFLVIILLYHICHSEKVTKRWYIGFILCSILGIHTLLSFGYYLAIICSVSGIFLFLYHRDRIIPLCISCICCIIGSFLLWMPMLIVQGCENCNYDVSTFFFSDPSTMDKVLHSGLQDVFQNRWILENSGKTIWECCVHIWQTIGNVFPIYPHVSSCLVLIICFLGCCLQKNKQSSLYIRLLIGLSLPITLILMILQGITPYYRIYIYLAVPISLGVASILHFIIDWKYQKVITYACYILFCYFIVSLHYDYFENSYLHDTKFQKITTIIPWKSMKTICSCSKYSFVYLDFYSKIYHKQFKVDIHYPDVLLVYGEKLKDKEWLIPYEKLPWKWAYSAMYCAYRDDYWIVYIRR
ncbi:MAG: glycosyltransferase family 39 protein [Planctomycetes bacterium]|nr:glycosyltransferase family 39 protein [Planctomycetota bacterium]